MIQMPFNIRSGPQMQEFLFEFLKLKPLKEKNDKGNYSVAVDVLTHYAEKQNIQFCKELLDYRKLVKAFNTYIKGIERFIMTDGCIHGDYWLSTTNTFRSSASDPNTQNISKHGDIIDGIPWNDFRKIFAAWKVFNTYKINNIDYNEPGWLIGEVDYVGAEVKIAAALTDDEQLITDLNNDLDMHSHWANEIFGINKPLPEIKKNHKDERFLAKNNFTFANLFGAGHTSIAKEFRNHDFYINYVKSIYANENKKSSWTKFFTEYSENQIKEAQEAFYSRYKGVKEWQDWVVRKYYDTGYVENPFGFRRRYPLRRNEIINFPIQSTSFHLLLYCLILIEKEMEKRKMQSKLCGQVHDSGFFLIKIEEAEEVMDLVSEIMETKHFKWQEKIKVESEWELGDSWANIKLENKPFKALHISSGQELNYNVFHWFAYDMGFNPDTVFKVLMGKEKIDGWELKYT